MIKPIKKRTALTRTMIFAGIWVLLGIVNVFPALGGEVLDRVKAKQIITCGVPETIPGFCIQDINGRWQGFNVDFCRALAVAVLDDPDKVDFIPLSASSRLPVLLSGRIDLLAHLSTWTFAREAGIGIKFPGVYFYDGHTFMTAAAKNINNLKDLDGDVICVMNKTNHLPIVNETFNRLKMKFKPLAVESQDELVKALQEDRCMACVGPSSWLAALRTQIPGGLKKYKIMKDNISKEPLCPVVQQEDDEWATLVRWVIFALIEAEELGVTSLNVRDLQSQSTDPKIQWFLNSSGQPAKILLLNPGWVADVIEAVGNYGEIYDRNLGDAGGLKIDRGLNRLWNQGGLLYSPPFR